MDLANVLINEPNISKRKQYGIVLKLSIPAILAQTVSIVMQYIDVAMVGSLGAEASASIGLVESTGWLIGGLSSSLSAGFSVQVAHNIGAGKPEKARQIVKQAYLVAICFSLCLMGFAMAISKPLPIWLGGDESVAGLSSTYFFIYAIALPMHQLNSLSASMLQCSGNMKVPSFLQGMMCVLDVIFNALFIFPTRQVSLLGITIKIPGAGLGVAGAALGTTLAFFVIGVIMVFMVCVKSPALHFRREEKMKLDREVLKRAVKIGLPMAFEHSALCGAMVASTKIVAPLGNVAIAANSFAVTAEGLCYMPGYGFSAAATTLVGQSIGAKRFDMAKRFSKLSVAFGMAVMAVTGALMYVAAPFVFSLFTPVKEVQELGVHVLRIELFAEPLFAASIVSTGALRGAGDTLIPGIMNLVSIWGVRITLSLLMVGNYGLSGVWIAMCIELCFRGIIFLIRLARGKWLNQYLEEKTMRQQIEHRQFDEERALYHLQDADVVDCTFAGPADGESVLKESRNIGVSGCKFSLRYPLWHVKGFSMTKSEMDPDTRAPIWYAEKGVIDDCVIHGIKAVRECSDITVRNSRIESPEFGWKSSGIVLEDTEIESEYIFLDSKNVKLNRVHMKGKYSFQYMENVEIKDSHLDTKDAFWHSKNVTVKNSTVRGEYLGWFSENLTLIDCTIIGTQPLCYCEKLKLVNCKMENTDLAFEYSDVDADVVGNILSVKNPKSGDIRADSVGEIIRENPVMKCTGKVTIRKNLGGGK